MHRYQQTKHVLGSTAYLTIVIDDSVSHGPVFISLWQAIDAFEQRFSRFLPGSELSKFNRAAGKKQAISPEFHELLSASTTMSKLTNGLYSPFILPSLQRAGYKGSWPRPQVADAQLNFESRRTAPWSEIEVYESSARIPEDTALDFGGIGKGYLLDQLAALLMSQSVSNYWLSLGGDILCSGYDATGDPWRIAVGHAVQEGKTVAAVKNAGRKLAVATSGITKRQGISEQGAWHHIIDPRTGKPAKTDILTATVCTSSGTLADVAAKCLVIIGSTDTEQTLQRIGVPDAVLQIKEHETVTIDKIGSIWSA